MIADIPKTLRTTGKTIMILSAILLFTHLMSVLMYYTIAGDEILLEPLAAEYQWLSLLKYFPIIVSMLLVLDVGLIIGGYYLMKFEAWSSILLTLISVIYTLLLWAVEAGIYMMVPEISALDAVKFSLIFSGLIWSSPLLVLIYFLNRSEVQTYLKGTRV